MSSDKIDCYLLDVIKIKISYIDVVENFWIWILASNQIISIGQSPFIRFVHFPIKSKVMNWKKDFSSVFFIFILVVETDIEKKSLLYVFGFWF